MNKEKAVIAIVAMNADRVIGKQGDLPWHYPEDLKRFKRLTIDSTVIMGRKTWQSIGEKPLPRRRNIVITSQHNDQIEHYSSVEAALSAVDDDVWIIGGGQIYRAALNFCTAIDVTWVPEKVDGDDLVRFPELDTAQWQAGEIIKNETDPRLSHQRYVRLPR